MPLASFSCGRRRGCYKRTVVIRERQSQANTVAWQNPKIRAKYLLSFVNRPLQPENVKAMQKALAECWKDPGWVKRWLLTQPATKSQYVHKDRDAHYKAISESLKGRIFTDEHRRKLSKARKLRVITEEQKKKQSQAQKVNWANPEFAKRMAISQGRNPNKAELKLQSILNEYCPNEWKYVGDGQVWINGRNPDFINVNGKKQVIELFSHYWHIERARTDDDEQNRINCYKEYGFGCFIIWESQLTKMEVLRCLR